MAPGTAHTYRADGMRVRKQNQAGLNAGGTLVFNTAGARVERTYYDGQMPLEEEAIVGGTQQTLTRNFLGGRGLEAISTTESANTSTVYPLYDAHGNMVATLTKNAPGTSLNVGDLRSYDVWGGIRSGATSGGPKGRYVANLGHVQDGESGLNYMRARYYEPGTGRFLPEDPAMDGGNWFVYCANSPAKKWDKSGTVTYFAETNSLMVGLQAVMLSGQSTATAVWRIKQLIDAMELYIGMALDEVLRYQGIIDYHPAQMAVDPNAETTRQRMEIIQSNRALQTMSRTEAMIGKLYVSQMMLCILMKLMEAE